MRESVNKNLQKIEKLKQECTNLMITEQNYNEKEKKSIVFCKKMKSKIKNNSDKKKEQRWNQSWLC